MQRGSRSDGSRNVVATIMMAMFVAIAVTAAVLWRANAGESAARTAVGPIGAGRDHADRGEGHPLDATSAVTLDAAAEELAAPRCIGALLAIDGLPGLVALEAAFARGLPGGDAAVADYLSDLVAERVGGSAELALQVLAAAEGAPPEAASVLLAGLARCPGARDARVVEGLIALGARPGGNEDVRAAALDALRTQPRLGAYERAQLASLAGSEGGGRVAWHAARALGSVMAEAERGGESSAPYWDELYAVARASDDAAVRAVALEAPMHADNILPRARIGALLELLPSEPHRDLRELVIFQLGLTDAPDDALEAMRVAFDAEYDECVRWAMVRFSVRAAGARALPLVEHFARVDPAFVDDVADFRRLFDAGVQDFEQIWLRLPERHVCAVEDGEPHGDTL